MKLFGAVFVAILAVGPLSAQYWSIGGFGNIAFPALGHAPAGGNPWGNIVSPALPQGPALASRNGGLGSGRHRAASSGIYAYPAYVGGYGYPYANPDAPTQGDQAPAQSSAPPQVVINQYFGTAPGDQGPPPDAAASNFHYYQAPANTDAAPPSDASYYLIAFKDHTVYSAVAYYTEGDTLHYFTSGNVHNQASISLVDRQLTEQLNRAHNVDVRLPQ